MILLIILCKEAQNFTGSQSRGFALIDNDLRVFFTHANSVRSSITEPTYPASEPRGRSINEGGKVNRVMYHRGRIECQNWKRLGDNETWRSLEICAS